MIIQTRKCDVCGTRHDSDDYQNYTYYGSYRDMNGATLDVCPPCETRLLEPLAKLREANANAKPAE
jgi:hypothetical protein